MKSRFWLLLTLLLVFSLAACQSAATPKPETSSPAVTEAPAATEAVTQAPVEEQQPPLSEEGQPYPPQGAEAQAQPETEPTVDPNSPYPAPGEAETIGWSEAEEIILSGEVMKITQTKALEIMLLLEDGRLLITTEPAIDEVLRVKEACGEKCSHVTVTTEN
jgi:hypothetical protein